MAIEALERRTLLSADFGYVLTTSSWQQGQDVAVDAAGNAYLVGDNRTVAKYDPSGNLVWFTTFDETGYSNAKNHIALDAAGDIYITGAFAGIGTFGSFSLLSPGTGIQEAFTAKLNNKGAFVWAKDWFSANSNSGNSIAVDSQGNVYTGGTFSGAIFPDVWSGRSA